MLCAECAGVKRKRRECDSSDELSGILAKYIEVTEECDAMRRVLEAELEDKRREQEKIRGTRDLHKRYSYTNVLVKMFTMLSPHPSD